MSAPKCDKVLGCQHPVAYIDTSGFVLCAAHHTANGWRRERKLRPHEIRQLRDGLPLPSYEPTTARELSAWNASRHALGKAVGK